MTTSKMNIVQQEPIAWIEWDLELDEGDPSSVMVQQIKPDLCYKGWDWRPLVLATPQQAERAEAIIAEQVQELEDILEWSCTESTPVGGRARASMRAVIAKAKP